MIQSSLFLRRVLQLDAIVSGATGLLLAFGANSLASIFHLPEGLLRESGLFLIAYGLAVGWLSSREAVPKLAVAIVIAGNAVWTVASIGLLLSGTVAPNMLGEGFVAIQAIAVGVLAELQFVGLRRSNAVVGA